MLAPAVVVAAVNLMPALRERLRGEGELLTFADTEPIQALQAILSRRPSLVVLERLFAATPRGAALINRIKNDPLLAGTEVRVMSHNGDYTKVVRPAGGETVMAAAASGTAGGSAVAAAPAVAASGAPLDWHGTRRTDRYVMRPGVEIQLDGNPATVVDLSGLGAQVLSATILRPNQRVRISMPTEEFVMRFRGVIAWAQFELPVPTGPPRYRAGVDFIDADAAAMQEYCERHKI